MGRAFLQKRSVYYYCRGFVTVARPVSVCRALVCPVCAALSSLPVARTDRMTI